MNKLILSLNNCSLNEKWDSNTRHSENTFLNVVLSITIQGKNCRLYFELKN